LSEVAEPRAVEHPEAHGLPSKLAADLYPQVVELGPRRIRRDPKNHYQGGGREVAEEGAEGQG
jgi:hypothetical protein